RVRRLLVRRDLTCLRRVHGQIAVTRAGYRLRVAGLAPLWLARLRLAPLWLGGTTVVVGHSPSVRQPRPRALAAHHRRPIRLTTLCARFPDPLAACRAPVVRRRPRDRRRHRPPSAA